LIVVVSLLVGAVALLIWRSAGQAMRNVGRVEELAA
jgi:hypothetical protein